MDRAPEVVTIGHAIVDVLAPSLDELVSRHGLERGTMTLVDDDRAEAIYASLGPATEISGGSAANTAACLASFGASVAFVGKVKDDQLGRVFAHDIKAAGVRYQVSPAPDGLPTGRSLIMVSPDAEKTMCTSLGAGATLQPSDLDEEDIRGARVLYVEGYMYGRRPTNPAIEHGISVAREAGTRVALSLSDPYWVELQQDELERLLDQVDLLFANEQEAIGMTGAADGYTAMKTLAERVPTVAVTCGAEGSRVASPAGIVDVGALPVHTVVDTTGAGDSYAAGFLYGWLRDQDCKRCAELGALAASEMVSHLGARPQTDLADLARQAGLI